MSAKVLSGMPEIKVKYMSLAAISHMQIQRTHVYLRKTRIVEAVVQFIEIWQTDLYMLLYNEMHISSRH